MTEDTKSYEIFKKELDNTTVLVESVKGIDEAQKSLERLKEESAGEYFIFDPLSAKVIDPLQPITGSRITKTR
jgi:hypothetical protein